MNTDDLEPLGGLFEGKLWPVDSDGLAAIEAATGWPLPDDYKSFVTAWGASRPSGGYWTVDCGPDNTDTIIDMFFGAPPERSASVVEMAGDYLETRPLLVVARADNGLFFMEPEGKIIFERARDPELRPVADSFGDFFDKITFHGDEF